MFPWPELTAWIRSSLGFGAPASSKRNVSETDTVWRGHLFVSGGGRARGRRAGHGVRSAPARPREQPRVHRGPARRGAGHSARRALRAASARLAPRTSSVCECHGSTGHSKGPLPGAVPLGRPAARASEFQTTENDPLRAAVQFKHTHEQTEPKTSRNDTHPSRLSHAGLSILV